MGWYTALTCGGAVSPESGFTIADTMGTLMHSAMIGGQVVYPVVGEDWCPDPTRKAQLLAQVGEIAAQDGHVLALSIDLGGMLVLAGNAEGLAAFEAAVPKVDKRFPMRLNGHAGFHTDLQTPVSERAPARHGTGSVRSTQRASDRRARRNLVAGSNRHPCAVGLHVGAPGGGTLQFWPVPSRWPRASLHRISLSSPDRATQWAGPWPNP